MRKILIAFLMLVVFLPNALGQLWKRERQFVFAGFGATGFMGELGGANRTGTQFLRDFDFGAIRPGGIIGYRYFINYDLAITGNLAIGYVSGNDRQTLEPFRNNRNIMFRSSVLETSVQGEWFFYTDGRIGARYRDQTRAIGWIGYRLRAYLFAGVGGFFFNPKGYFNGEHYLTLNHATVGEENLPRDGWYNLRPLRTEGQGFSEFPTRKKYIPVSLVVPMGLGITFSISREVSLGMQYGFRKTYTDYLDDTSTTYVDPGVFGANWTNPSRIALAEYFSNPTNYSKGTAPTMPGEQRGRPQYDDSYMFLFLSIQYKIISGPTSQRWAPFSR